MATLQRTFHYEGTASLLPFTTVRLTFDLPAFDFATVLRDGKPFIERRQVTTESASISENLTHDTYSAHLPNSYLIGSTDSSVINFWKFLSYIGSTRTDLNILDYLSLSPTVSIAADSGEVFGVVGMEALYSVSMATEKYAQLLKNLNALNARLVPDDQARRTLELELADYVKHNIFVINKSVFAEVAAQFRTIVSNLNDSAFLTIISHLTDVSTGKPAFKATASDFEEFMKVQFGIDKAEIISAITGLVADSFDRLFDFPITVPEISIIDVKGNLTIQTSDGSSVALTDFQFYDLRIQYVVEPPGDEASPVSREFDWNDVGSSDLAWNTVPFQFSSVIGNFITSPVYVTVKSFDGSLLWQKDFEATNPELQALEIIVPLSKPAVLSSSTTSPSIAGNKILHGKVIEMSGNCILKGTTVVIQARTEGDLVAKVVGVATTDGSGNFSMTYPYGVYVAAQAIVSLTPDSLVDLAIHSEPQHVSRKETIADDFLYLLLKDAGCSPKTQDDGCDCDEPRRSHRLPGQEELIGSDDYMQDIGGSCVNLSTPNRTISEYAYRAVVRTSDPDVANYVLSKDATGVFTLKGGQTTVIRKPVGLSNPIYWQDAPDNKNNLSLYQAVSVATGHILHYKILMKADGYSLGELLYSLPLAPGQTKNMAITKHTHTLQGSETQQSSQRESLAASLINDVSITDTLAGNINEATRGSSSASTAGVSGGLGLAGIIYGVAGVAGVSGGVATADSTASQNSSRSVAQYFQEHIRNGITQNAQSYRELNASVITTVNEGQSYAVTSEVIANHNHCHSLTMMYFEVLKHYAIYQDLSAVEECLFIPLLMTEFSRENVYKWRDVLASSLLPMASETYLQPFNALKTGRQHPLLRAFDAIERIKTNYVNVDYPAGAYDDEVINFITGEIYIQTHLPRPKSKYDRIKSWPIENKSTWSWSGALIGGILGGTAGPLGAIVGGYLNSDGTVKAEAYPIIDSFISVDANYASVPPAQCIRVRKIDENFFEEGGFDRAQWTAYATLLGKQLLGDTGLLSYYFKDRLISEWDSIYYNDIAPLVFESICRKISIGTWSAIDVSSESKYRGGDVLMRINLRGSGANRKRNEITSLTLSFDNAASLSNDWVTLTTKNVVIRYSTAHYNGVLLSGYAGDELIDGTVFPTPENANEKKDPRKEDEYVAARLVEHLNSNLEYYNRELWRRLGGDKLVMLLDGFNIETYDEFGQPVGFRSLASVVKNELIAISGNALIMPVAPGYKIDRSYIVEQPIEGPAAGIDLFEHYKPLTPDPGYRVSVSCDGVFVDAIQGACDACEKVKENTSQDWDRFKADEPTAINPVTTPVPVVTDWRAAFKEFVTPMVNIQNAPAAPAPGAGLAGLSELLGKGDVFKDITGLDANQKNALQTYLSNQQNAKDFGQMAKDLYTLGHNTEHSDKIADSIRNSPELTKEEKAELLKNHFNQMIDGGQAKKAAEAANGQDTRSSLTDAAVKAADQGKAVKATSAEPSGKSETVDISGAPGGETTLGEPGVFDWIPDPSSWALGHSSALSNDETFDRSGPTLANVAFNEDEHLEVGKSMTATIDAWAQAGLIEGGAMIDEKVLWNGVGAKVDDWEIVLPDRTMPGDPYHAVRPLSNAHWHYIVPDPVFRDGARTMRWTADTLRTAIKNGEAAALTFGQLVFMGGDWVETFDQLHKPFLYKTPVNIMSFAAKKDLLAMVMLDLVQNGSTGAVGKYTDLKDLEKIAAGQMKKGGWLRVGPDIDALLTAFDSIQSAPFGPLHLIAQFTASKQLPLDWTVLSPHVTWGASQRQNLRLAGINIQERMLQILLSNGHFLDMALRNERHFSSLNWATFETEYTRALSDLQSHLASVVSTEAPIPAAVLARVGFGLHFLTDAFAAGHIRTPRSALGAAPGGGVMCAKVMHDIENRLGLIVTNGFGDTWKAYGDGSLKGPVESDVRAVHDEFARLSPNALTAYDANYTQVVAAVAEAVLMVHYEAQRLREAGSAPSFPILDTARFAGLPNLPVIFRGDNLAPLGPHFPLGVDGVALSSADKTAHIRKHQPSPVAIGTDASTNLPPLYSQFLQLDTSRTYWQRNTNGKLQQYVEVVAHNHLLTFDVTHLYHLADIGKNHPLPGVPKEKLLLDLLSSSGLPEMP